MSRNVPATAEFGMAGKKLQMHISAASVSAEEVLALPIAL